MTEVFSKQIQYCELKEKWDKTEAEPYGVSPLASEGELGRWERIATMAMEEADSMKATLWALIALIEVW